MRRAASRLSRQCHPASGSHPGVRPPLCVDCRLALPHATLGLVVIRSILSSSGRCLVEIPRVDGFQHLHWSWQECLLSTVWPFLLIALVPGISLVSVGVTSRFRPGWLKPSIVALLLALALPAVFFILGHRKKLDAESWAFLLIMPGLAEELVFRGVYQSLLNRVFGKPWRLAGAEFGWGLIITAILFAGFNGLVVVDPQLHARIVPHAAIAPVLVSLVSGWVRERTDSVWPCVFGHNLSNLVIPFASLFT
jgi:membrane protease YdiL (CAAX protease family)